MYLPTTTLSVAPGSKDKALVEKAKGNHELFYLSLTYILREKR